ncbi:RnfABCDGE type electron transport complex subunit D, partial [Pseudoalteromonas sp. 19-MNA-CIBAN-0066]|uniref:RnfABCDGE type electron transport complex subunit D n=1 Tax=Pseudoalteromonas sp. 19-MNA-CIBAN-0066 TaxID=3140422 RepID=UPI0033175DEE
VLLALSIPPLAPWWIVIIVCLFAIVIVKQLYGGLGFNLFKPAMAAYVLLLISFTVQINAWMPNNELLNNPICFNDQLRVFFTEFNSNRFSL